MAGGLTAVVDRRDSARVSPANTPWPSVALLRPGREIVVINLSPGGALVQSPSRMNPGARTELHFPGPSRRVVRGRIERCRVVAINPLRYEGAIVFDEPLDCGLTPATE